MYSNEDYLIGLLQDAGYINQQHVAAAAQARKGTETALETMIRTGALREEDVARTCAHSASMEFLGAAHLTVPPSVLDMVSPEVAKRYRVVPIHYDGQHRLKLALSDPFDFETLDSLPHLIPYELDFVCTTPSAVRQALVQYYGDVEKAVKEFESRLGDFVSESTGAASEAEAGQDATCYWRFEFEGNAFLHHMVRNIMGCLIAVGQGLKPPTWMAQVLAARSRDAAAPTFSPDGLYFLGPVYDPRWGLPTRTPAYDWLP